MGVIEDEQMANHFNREIYQILVDSQAAIKCVNTNSVFVRTYKGTVNRLSGVSTVNITWVPDPTNV